MAAQAIANSNPVVNVYTWPALPVLAPGVVRTIELCITITSLSYAIYLHLGSPCLFDGINEFWRKRRINASDKAKESMALAQYPKQLGLSYRNITAQVNSIIDGFFNCHEGMAVCEIDKQDFSRLLNNEKVHREKAQNDLASANRIIQSLKNELRDEKNRLNDCRQQGFFSRLVNPK